MGSNASIAFSLRKTLAIVRSLLPCGDPCRDSNLGRVYGQLDFLLDELREGKLSELKVAFARSYAMRIRLAVSVCKADETKRAAVRSIEDCMDQEIKIVCYKQTIASHK